ncbi:MAG: hypothetical protein ACYS99_03085 [Planctomycetota bacterium]|jgi:hypothetical protein
MRWTIALLAAATAFLMGILAVRDHTALVRAGYEISELERLRERLDTSMAHRRARLSYLSSPAALAERGRAFGLVTDYPREHAVEKVGPVKPGNSELLAQID